ncbi:glycosyltransferase family 4 protein [Albirhodobacter sp. R86504]|uniref:glycosyltransferase family 4 protein n=1 Tax=Albirhodobacter sp. R86504 TaxID=3093848 RepID=UPI00366EB2B1
MTGVQRVEREILGALDQMTAAGEIEAPEIVLPAVGEIIAPPDLKSLKLTRVGTRTGHLWEQIDLPQYARGKMLWCLGNTAPIVSLMSRDTRVLTMVHDLSYKYVPEAYSWKFRAFYSALIPIAFRKSDVVVTVSNSEKAAISEHYPFLRNAETFHAVQNGGVPDDVALKAHAEEFPPMEARGYGIYVGSLSKRKNAEGVLKAAIRFLESYPEMRFVVIGAGSAVFDSFEIDIPDAVKDRLELRGQINDPTQIYAAFAQARFLLFPSFYEASPMPVVEAMTFGCPVIASSIPSLTERCGEAALYCQPHDQTSISDAIDRLMTSPDLWETLSAAGRSKAATYSWAGQTNSLLRLSGVAR